MRFHSNPAGTWSPRGRGFSMGVAPAPGRTIHLTGQVAWDPEERIVGKDDVAEQTRQCFRNIKVFLHLSVESLRISFH